MYSAGVTDAILRPRDGYYSWALTVAALAGTPEGRRVLIRWLEALVAALNAAIRTAIRAAREERARRLAVTGKIDMQVSVRTDVYRVERPAAFVHPDLLHHRERNRTR